VRYAVFSDITGRGRWRLWLDVSDGVYGMSLDQATLFKKKHVAQAVAKAYSAGRKSPLLLVKITTKSGKRRALKYEKYTYAVIERGLEDSKVGRTTDVR
jgi:hypothetical protein